MWFSFYALPDEYKNIFISWEVGLHVFKLSNSAFDHRAAAGKQGRINKKSHKYSPSQGTMVTSDVVYLYCYHKARGLLKDSDLKTGRKENESSVVEL